MRKYIKYFSSFIFSFILSVSIINFPLFGQEHQSGKDAYVYPEDPLVIEKLEEWQDLKFGFMMHWGIYAQLGIVESWALCSEDQSFQDRGGIPYTEFKEMYFSQIREFDPRSFDPELWAKAAKEAGMKYLVFTTKHHDGFCMFDTKQTDFKITGDESPFHDHPKANIAYEVFNAFRDEGFLIGAYFSKPDWHNPDYWSPLWATPNRNNNYDIRKYPEKWQRFRDYTYYQIEELMTGYGPIDILWLDGGWVRPDSTINDEVRSWGFDIAKWEQDIDMPRIAKMARRRQPGLMIVDRSVHGPYENYRTPEQNVPAETLPYPWETCMTMTQNWGYVKNPVYKSTKQLIHTLINVVSKGGNFLLNAGPTPEGILEEETYNRLRGIGEWMKVNGEAIYSTRKHSSYSEGNNIRYTSSKDGRFVYAFLLEWPGKDIRLEKVIPEPGSTIDMLGIDQHLNWTRENNTIIIELPESLDAENKPPAKHAWVLRIKQKRN